MIEKDLFSVSALNNYIKHLFDKDFTLRGLRLKGEVSNFKKYPSGHYYFTLKDKESTIRAVMFAQNARFMHTSIKDGDEVIVTGYVSVYPARGEYQFYAEAMELYGQGSQLLELELLKKKLASEGLFDPSRKRKLNPFPRVVGVISAPNSAALADIKKNLLRRNPLLEVKEFPSLVQGADAPKELLKALKLAKEAMLDVLIIGRGGGASEDLNAFNDETLVREASKFPVPIISAVGHEIDFTLIDYVADARASTPTGAAELATIDKREIYERLENCAINLDETMVQIISNLSNRLKLIKANSFFVNPKSMYEKGLIDVENTKARLDIAMKHLIEMRKEKVALMAKELKSISVDSTIQRGFSITETDDGKIVKDIKDVELNQMIKTRLKGGVLTAKVVNKEAK